MSNQAEQAGRAIQTTPLLPCRFCKKLPDVDIKVAHGNHQVYAFSISHACEGFEGGHNSVFFKNQTPHDQCVETLQNCVTLYSRLWNRRHNTVATREEWADEPVDQSRQSLNS